LKHRSWSKLDYCHYDWKSNHKCTWRCRFENRRACYKAKTRERWVECV